MRCVRRLCSLLPRQVLPRCAWCAMCCTLTLCHRHPPLGTGTQPLALEMFKIQAQASDILTSGLPASYFSSPSLTFSVPHSWCASFAICYRSQRVLYLFAFSLPLLMNITWCMLDSATVSGPDVSLGLCHLGCCLPSYPTFLLVPCCTPAVQDSDLLITPAS